MKKPKLSVDARRFWHKLLKNKLAVFGLFICLLAVFLCLFGSFVAPYEYSASSVKDRLKAPNADWLLGTDELGRDTLSRIIAGTRITVVVGLCAVGIALLLGSFFGLVSGYYGGRIDTVISGFMDAIWSFPAIILALAITTVLGSSIRNIFIAIGIVYTPNFFRLVRSRTLTIRESEYVMGAKAIGLNDFEIILRYILPNMSSTLIVQVTLSAAKAIIAESSLSFLGLGVQPPLASWGAMLKSGYAYLSRAPWLSVFPGLAIMLLVLGLNFLGDGLRDALDVRIRAD